MAQLVKSWLHMHEDRSSDLHHPCEEARCGNGEAETEDVSGSRAKPVQPLGEHQA